MGIFSKGYFYVFTSYCQKRSINYKKKKVAISDWLLFFHFIFIGYFSTLLKCHNTNKVIALHVLTHLILNYLEINIMINVISQTNLGSLFPLTFKLESVKNDRKVEKVVV